MAAAAGACGIPIAVLKRAKKAGCAAFQHGRVDLAAFLKWHFSRGATDTGPSLEAARARLATSRAKQIEAESAIAGGALPSGWAVGVVGEVFEDGRLLWLNERIPLLVHRVCNGKQDASREAAEAEVEYVLSEDAQTIHRVLRHLRATLESKLRAGPDGEVETDAALAARILKELSARLTPAAKAELLTAMETSFPAAADMQSTG
jgi:hypothetical protein